jgi:hypothetical protein
MGAVKPVCRIEDCHRISKTSGLCEGHYWRLRKHGDPLKGRIPKGEARKYFNRLIQGLSTQTKDCIEWPFASTKGYAVIQDGKSLLKSAEKYAERNLASPRPAITKPRIVAAMRYVSIILT